MDAGVAPQEARQEAGNYTPGAFSLKAAIVIERAKDPHTPHKLLAMDASAMPPETTTAAAGGVALWKALGGIAAFAAIGTALAAIVAMCMMTPRSPKEWAVGLVSTVVSSLAGGAFIILKFGLHKELPTDDVGLFIALVALLGLVFACGLPGWALVRAVFTWLAKRDGLDIAELAQAARADAARVIAP